MCSQKFVGLGLFLSKSYLQNNHMKREGIMNFLKMKNQSDPAIGQNS